MPEEFHFCFSFVRITIDTDTVSFLDLQPHFQFQLLRQNKPIGHTHPIPCQLNDRNQIAIEGQIIKFKVKQRQIQLRDLCQLRLIEVLQNKQEKLIGCYEFVLNHYITAYSNLNRSCIELSVQMGPNYVIQYVVYLQKTTQALQRIIEQHEQAKKLTQNDNNQEQETFYFPEEASKINLQDEYRELNIDNQNPICLHQRFWSPTRRRRSKSNRKYSKSNLDNSKTVLNSSNSNSDLDKKGSTLENTLKQQDQIEEVQSLCFSRASENFHQILDNEIEIDTNTENGEAEQGLNQLYLTIRSDSKILLPGLDDNYELYKSPVKQKQKEHTYRFTRQNISKMIKHSAMAQYIKYWFTVIIGLLIMGIILSRSIQTVMGVRPSRNGQWSID